MGILFTGTLTNMQWNIGVIFKYRVSDHKSYQIQVTVAE